MLTPSWQGNTTHGAHLLKMQLGYASPKTSYESGATATWLNLALEHSYSRAVAGVGGVEIQLGSLLTANYRLGYYPVWDDSHMYWSNFIGAGLTTRLIKTVGDRKLYFVQFTLPLAGAISRPQSHRDYKIEDTAIGNIVKLNHQNLQLATLNRHLNPVVEAGCQLKFSEKFSTAYFYQLSYVYMKASYSGAYQELQHRLGIKFLF